MRDTLLLVLLVCLCVTSIQGNTELGGLPEPVTDTPNTDILEELTEIKHELLEQNVEITVLKDEVQFLQERMAEVEKENAGIDL